MDPNCNLIVNYIPSFVTPDMLRTMFEPHGNVVEAIIVTDKRTHEPRGFGFVRSATSPRPAAITCAELGGLRSGR